MHEHSSDDRVVVVAAANAWPFYQRASAYVCQAGRSFQAVSRLGFYSRRTIHGAAPEILEIHDGIILSQAEAARRVLSVSASEQRLGEVITAALSDAWREGGRTKIMLLSSLDDPRTLRFDPITHRGRSAWTMYQRYARADDLGRARTTDDVTGGRDDS